MTNRSQPAKRQATLPMPAPEEAPPPQSGGATRPPPRPIPAEDALLGQPLAPRVQDYDQRPGIPRAG